MNNVEFYNCKSEDCLNITKSNINLNNISISNSTSDGIDLDFVEGNLKNIIIDSAIGDGLDISGSNLILKNIDIKNSEDKCISIGENSDIELYKINLDNCYYGLVIKDAGYSTAKDIQINRMKKYDIATYKKKTFYNSGLKVEIENLISNDKFFSQNDTFLKINNKIIINSNITTKQINTLF